jgi:hypothetical protein
MDKSKKKLYIKGHIGNRMITKNQNNICIDKSIKDKVFKILVIMTKLNLLSPSKKMYINCLYFIIFGIIFFSYIACSITITPSFAQLSTNNNSNTSSYTIFPDSSSATDKSPAFLDAYWTNYLSSSSTSNNNSVKKEVGPGDGSSTLAIVLVNKGRSDITGVTGYLNMPSSGGFKPIEGKNNGTSQSVASAYSIVKSGDTFVLYFDMDVLKQAKVGGYSTVLNLRYSKINQIGELMTAIKVPFRLTGKVILDAVSENSQLIPSTPNQLKILIQNKGSANAAGVVVAVTGITSGTGGTSGNTQSVSDASSSGTSLSNTNTSVTNPAVQQSVSSPTSNPAVNVGSSTFDIGTISANGTAAEITPIIYPSVSAGETVQNLNIQITYDDSYGNQQISNIPIGLIISPTPPQSVLNITTNKGNALTITSGKIQDLNLTLANSDTKNPITNVVATLASQSSSVQILGDSRWTFNSVLPQTNLNLFTKVFASANLVGQPTLFTLTINYISAGQSKTDTLNIGAYVSGDIKLRAYDVGINFIGGKPNLIGNLLNEGNTVGLFTTVETIKSNSSKNYIPVLPSQYLGDLSVDSPLPFSIPINVDNKTMATIPPGPHPITLKITYSDDLKVQHQLLVNSSVDFKTKQSQSARAGNSDGSLFGAIIASIVNNMVFFVIIVAVIILVIFLIKKRKSTSKKTKFNSSSEMESFLDDVSSTNTNTSEDFLNEELKRNKVTGKKGVSGGNR